MLSKLHPAIKTKLSVMKSVLLGGVPLIMISTAAVKSFYSLWVNSLLLGKFTAPVVFATVQL